MDPAEIRRRLVDGERRLAAGNVFEAIGLWAPVVRDPRASPPENLAAMVDQLSVQAKRDRMVWSFIVEVAEAAIGRGVDDTQTLGTLCRAYLATGRADRAAPLADHLVRRAPRDWRSWYVKSLTCSPAERIACLRTVMALEPFAQAMAFLIELGEAYWYCDHSHNVLVIAHLLSRFPPGPWSRSVRQMGEDLEFRARLRVGELDTAEAMATRHLGRVGSAVVTDTPSEFVVGAARDLVFLHVPKTGGVSILTAMKDESRVLNLGHRYLTGGTAGHDSYYFVNMPSSVSLDVANNAKVFSCVRNIYPFLLSHYHWCRKGLWKGWAMHSVWANRYDFASYLEKLAENDLIWISKGLIFFPLFDGRSGELVVDWILRTEHLQQDAEAMCSAWGLTAPVIPHENRNTRGDYRQAYTPAMVDLVERTWADDIRLFGFDFEHGYRDGAPLRGDTAGMKGRVVYDPVTRGVGFRGFGPRGG